MSKRMLHDKAKVANDEAVQIFATDESKVAHDEVVDGDGLGSMLRWAGMCPASLLILR